MDAKTLALKMLEWGQLVENANIIEVEIIKAVLELKETQQVGNVRASYSKGRGKYNYKEAWNDAMLNDKPSNEYIKITYDYLRACKDTEIDVSEYYIGTSGPSVKLKLIK